MSLETHIPGDHRVADDTRPDVPAEVEEAVRTLLRWAGDDPDREGLIDTPRRVARAWKEYCSGYGRSCPKLHAVSSTTNTVWGF